MPTYQGQLSEEQILQLIAYIRSLGTGTEGGATGTATGATGPTTPRRRRARSATLEPRGADDARGGGEPVNTAPGTTGTRPGGAARGAGGGTMAQPQQSPQQ